MLTDYHLHFRSDELAATADEHFTQENFERYRRAADACAITELGVSEHIHRFREALTVWQHPLWQENAVDDLDRYEQFVRSCDGLKLGIEMDFVPGRESKIAAVLDSHEWDYVVGSVHFIKDAALDMEVYDVWHTTDRPEKIWRKYFDVLAQSARSGLYDVIAHPDLVKYWGKNRPLPEGDLRYFYEPAVAAFADSGVAVEYSTAGLRKPINEAYPAPAFLAMLVDAGCPIALSSDAHEPANVGFGYGDAVEQLRGAGVTEIATFERRKRTMAELG